MERTESLALLCRHVKGESLRAHCIATGAVMREAAVPLGGDPVQWEAIGILHDIDFEEVEGDMQRHGIHGAGILAAAGVDESVCTAVKRHNHHLFAGHTTPLEVALQAADAVSGLVIACALVKGGAVTQVTEKTVTKKFRDRGFAAGCDRDRILPVEALVPLREFYRCAIRGITRVKEELGLR
ncbi:MAG: HDIG domain-containing protein [Methanomicrobiales archaeon]|nr:HDIG domain-containing protein [Methanomicrobiales archaeon]